MYRVLVSIIIIKLDLPIHVSHFEISIILISILIFQSSYSILKFFIKISNIFSSIIKNICAYTMLLSNFEFSNIFISIMIIYVSFSLKKSFVKLSNIFISVIVDIRALSRLKSCYKFSCKYISIFVD